MKNLLLLFLVLIFIGCKKEDNSINSQSIKINYKVGSSYTYVANAVSFLDDTTSLNQDETFYNTDTFEISYPKDTIINQKKYIVEVRKNKNSNGTISFLEITDSSVNSVGYKYFNEVILYPTPYKVYSNPLRIGTNWDVNSIISINLVTMRVLGFETVNINQRNYICAVIGYNEFENNNSYSKYTEYLDENGIVKRNTEFKSTFRSTTSAGIVHSTSNIIRIQ